MENLETLPLLDDNLHEIPIYDEEGFRVLRRGPAHYDSSGCLLDLSKARTLFSPDEALAAPHARIPVYLYPLAFTRSLGNVQADDVVQPFHQRIAAINENIMDQEVNDNDNDSLFGEDSESAIQGLRCQVYNALAHRVRERAKFHAVQLGSVTGCLSGSGSESVGVRAKWQRRYNHCSIALPHQQFDQKVNGDPPSEAMRFENVYKLRLTRINPQYQNGRCVLGF